MIFNFLKYIRPVWYFNRNQLNGETVFPDPAKLPNEILDYIEWDNNYESEVSPHILLVDKSLLIFLGKNKF